MKLTGTSRSASPCGRGTQGRRAAATSSGQDSAELTGACVQPGKSSQQPAANNQQPAAHRETETCQHGSTCRRSHVGKAGRYAEIGNQASSPKPQVGNSSRSSSTAAKAWVQAGCSERSLWWPEGGGGPYRWRARRDHGSRIEPNSFLPVKLLGHVEGRVLPVLFPLLRKPRAGSFHETTRN